MTPEQREDWEERAAILEFDAGFERKLAEQLATVLVTKKGSGSDVQRIIAMHEMNKALGR